MAEAAWPVAPRAPKLRDSCNACATAKIRCGKQKPTCTRCQKRGLSCEYEVTRRAGRPYKATAASTAATSESDDTGNLQQKQCSMSNIALPSETYVFSPPGSGNTSPPMATRRPSPIVINPNVISNSLSCSQEDFQCLLTPDSSDSTFFTAETLPSFNPELDELFISTGPFATLATPPYDVSSLDSNDRKTFLYAESASVISAEVPQAPSEPHHFLWNSDGCLANYANNFQTVEPGADCDCLMVALNFLRGMSRRDSQASVETMEEHEHEAPATNQNNQCFADIQQLILRNDQIVKSLDSILNCSCSQQDGYLLTILSLILFRSLDRYAAAAQLACGVKYSGAHSEAAQSGRVEHYQHEMDLSPSSWYQTQGSDHNMYPDSGEHQGRLAIQTVLGELHHVQKLVKCLSERFRGVGIGLPPSNPIATAGEQFSTKIVDSLECRRSGPFSKTMFDQVEADLRRRLRMVSSLTVDMLRQL